MKITGKKQNPTFFYDTSSGAPKKHRKDKKTIKNIHPLDPEPLQFILLAL